MKYFPKLDGLPVITHLSILCRNTNVWQRGDSRPASWPGPEASVYHSQPACLPVPWTLCLSPSTQRSLHKLHGHSACLFTVLEHINHVTNFWRIPGDPGLRDQSASEVLIFHTASSKVAFLYMVTQCSKTRSAFPLSISMGL